MMVSVEQGGKKMRTVHTSPNGTADVVAASGFFVVRARFSNGTWKMLARFTATHKAIALADAIDA